METNREIAEPRVTGVIVAGTFGALLVFELRRPLRDNKENKVRRDARNFAAAV